MALQEYRLDTVRVDQPTIAAIPVNLIDVVWPQAEPLLKKAIDLTNEVTLESVYSRLKSGDDLLLTVSKGPDIIAAITLEIRTFDSGVKALWLPLVGGDMMAEWMDRVLEVSEAIAKDFSCGELRGIAVRKGWMRKLAPLGWEEVCTIVKKTVGD